MVHRLSAQSLAGLGLVSPYQQDKLAIQCGVGGGVSVFQHDSRTSLDVADGD